MTYWPSYGLLSPECRAGYLEWLASGRRDLNAYIGYVFLYFYGLERRVFADARDSDQARAEIPAIVDEVRRLQRAYGSNRSFERYSNQFLDAVTALAGGASDITPPMDPTGNELPIAVRVGVGRIVAAGKPLPPDWALSWFLTHPESPITTAIRRCSDEFRQLFRIRYSREFGDGLVLKPNRARLNARVEITPASASFGGHVEILIDLPDVAVLTSPLSKLQRIGESCATDLDAFSRWVGRNASSPKTIGAVALLPAELVTTHQRDSGTGLAGQSDLDHARYVGRMNFCITAPHSALGNWRNQRRSFSHNSSRGEATVLSQMFGSAGHLWLPEECASSSGYRAALSL
jgi:hypothetical protein